MPGLSLALGCDLVVCSDRARLSMIFAKRGLSLDNGASWLLPRLVGMARAKEIALFGGMWSGEEAAAIGLVNRVLPVDELDAFVDDWAATLAAGPPLALSMTKTLLHASSMASMEQAVEDEARCQALNFSTADTAEAMAAFGREAGAGLHRALVALVTVLNGVQGMVGDTALVTKAIEGAHHPGRIRARGEEWLAIPLDPDASIPVGTDVVVADVERGLLVVYAVDS